MRPPNAGSMRAPVDLLQVVLAGLVGRMGLAGEDDLHGPPRRVEDRLQPLGVVEDQLRPLVAGEAAGEADRQRVGIEQRAGGDDARGADLLVAPPLPRPLADEREQVLAQRVARLPELLVGNVQHARPERRIVVAIAPVGRHVLVEQPRHLVREPRRHVDAVGDRARPGRSRSGTPGQIGAHISRVTTPCSWLTALTPLAARSASAVMLNCGPEPLS